MALASPPDLDRYREALGDCVEETDRVLVMLDTLMDISEAESGVMPLQREPVRLVDVAARAVDLYRDVADAKGVTLVADAGADAVVSGDRVRLEQATANLIDNAVKYTPRGGRVSVAGRRAADASPWTCTASATARCCGCATPVSASPPTSNPGSGIGCSGATRVAPSVGWASG